MKTRNITWLKLALPAFLFLTICFTIKQHPTFADLLARAQMTFTRPDGFEETPVIENKQMNYDYALKLPAHDFEVRYAVRPLDEIMRKYEEMKKNKQPGTVMTNMGPNNFYPMTFQAILYNISGIHVTKLSVFPKSAVKQEFNADWGATAMVPLRKEFGQDYKDCMVVALHRDSIGDAYYFYMINNKEDVKAIPPIFHVLKF